MDRWNLHEAFVRVAESGSLSRAAKDLQMTQPAVSKRLERLEKEIGFRLLDRSPRGVRLTDAGMRYLDVVRRIRGELEEAEGALSTSRRGLSGMLRCSFPVALGETWLTRIALRFHALHPDLELQLDLTDRSVDLVEDGIDLTVRIGSRLTQSVSARSLGSFGFCLVASPQYLAKAGTPKTFEQLETHPFYAYFGDEERFLMPDGTTRMLKHPNTGIRLTNSRAILTAVLEHAGIARIPVWAAQEYVDEGKLRVVMPKVQVSTEPVNAVFLPSRYVPERVRQFVQFLLEETPKIPGWLPSER